MENTFMGFITEELKKARGGRLPEQNIGALSNKVQVNSSILNLENVFSINSSICEGSTIINYGLEIGSRKLTEIYKNPNLSFDEKEDLSNLSVAKGYVRIFEMNNLKYELLTNDFETVTSVPLNLGVPFYSNPLREAIVPDLNGKKLEEAIPVLCNALYKK